MTEKPLPPKTRRTKPQSPDETRVRAKYSAWGISEPTDPTVLSSLNGDEDAGENKDLQHLAIFYYLIPILGFFPALWTLYRRQGSEEQRSASRLAVTLAFCWLLGYFLLETGAKTTETLTIPLLIMSSALTSSYFLVSIWLMIRLWQRRPIKLPGISRLAEQMFGKRL